ncbi:MAG: hypothetical protein IM577_15070 [Chitinophagaceae bacterium]|jgi:hypothetical protein|nr:hypothetical protein [Chitinophagaceae bacterium]
MGAIRNFITSADNADAITKEQNAHLDTLSALANAKAELFKEKIKQNLLDAGTGTNKTIPITQVQDFISETHAYASSNADKISDTVSKALNGFVEEGRDNVTNGLCLLITTAITGLFGSSESSELNIEKYYVAVEGVAFSNSHFDARSRF